MSLLGTIAGAVIPKVIDSVFGKKEQKSETSTRVNYSQMRRDAEKAGFNPLTALQNGGAAGNATSTTTAPPALSSADFLGQALGAGVETWFNRDQLARDEEAESLKLATMREELVALQNRNKMPQHFGYSIPHVVGSQLTADGRSRQLVQPKLRPEASAPAKRSRKTERLGNPNKKPLAKMRPQARPTIDTIKRTPVFLPDGQMREIPASLGFNAWDYVPAGEYAELVGELRGEGEVAVQSVEVGEAAGIPMFGDRTKRQQRADNKHEIDRLMKDLRDSSQAATVTRPRWMWPLRD
ncbi:hypothetical protein ACSQ8I_21240 [Marinovum sp. E06]|uniref:hypothetical protein n=1 Tax=Marinovum sp. E06 TaxID=3449225 RepID=UPI003EDC5D9E